MRVAKYLVGSLAVCMVLVGCGKQRKAEAVVSDFIDKNITIDGYSVDFSPMDSTNRITADRIADMRKAVASDPLFKKGTALGQASPNGKYAFTRTRIINGTDTLVRTFYLDSELTRVVAFKMN